MKENFLKISCIEQHMINIISLILTWNKKQFRKKQHHQGTFVVIEREGLKGVKIE